jgi:hypothetical protein
MTAFSTPRSLSTFIGIFLSKFTSFKRSSRVTLLHGVSVSIPESSSTIGAMADFSWSDKKWWPSINVEAYTRDFSLPGGSDTGRYGVGGTNFNGSTSAIVLTVAGITIPMLADESDVAITGSITLTPVSWLTVE